MCCQRTGYVFPPYFCQEARPGLAAFQTRNFDRSQLNETFTAYTVALTFKKLGGSNMPIVMRLDRVMAEKKITSAELAARVGTSTVNLSNIKNGKIRGMRFSTLEALCQVLNCKPGDLIDYVTPEELEQERSLGEVRERSYSTPSKEASTKDAPTKTDQTEAVTDQAAQTGADEAPADEPS